MRNVLAESSNFIIFNEYERVNLRFKHSEREILIGDFYGDPEVAFISEDESYCVMGGCGIIVYFLREPFIDYQYDFSTEQWFELYRKNENIMWVRGIKSGTKPSSVVLEIEAGASESLDLYELNIYSKELKTQGQIKYKGNS